MTKLYKNYIETNLLNSVAFLRSLGYISQIVGGLHLAGTISLLGAIPLVFWGDKDYLINKPGDYLKKNALQIHSYAGIVTAIPIIYYGLNYFLQTK